MNGTIEEYMLNATQRRVTGSEERSGDKCTLEPMFGLNAESTLDNKESLNDGYDLFAKYRHVYAGTGNWLKVSNRITSYSYNYALDNNSYESRKSICKFLENQRKTKTLGTNIKGSDRQKHVKERYLFNVKKNHNKTLIGEKCKEQNNSQIADERKAIRAGETTNKFLCAAHGKYLPSHEFNRLKQNGEHKPAVKHISIDQTQKASQQQDSNYVLLPETLPNKAIAESENGNWLGCKIDHSQNDNKKAISKCGVINDHRKDMKVTTINQKDQCLSSSSDAEICENILQVKGISGLGISDNSAMQEDTVKTDGSQSCKMVKSTRKHMNLFSRLSQEAQAAMQEAINEMKDDDVDRKQNKSRVEKYNHQTKDTVPTESLEVYHRQKCSSISTPVSRPCSFVDLDQIASKQQIQRSIWVPHFASSTCISENSSSCKSGIARIKQCGSLPNGPLPSGTHRREGTFVITPMGYDSRFNDRPVMLDVTDETPEEVKEQAFMKCRDWLIKHT